MKLKSVAYHRNGVAGEGFHAIAFTDKIDGVKRDMIASVFSQHGCVSVMDAVMAAAGNVERGINSWRGDDYEPQLRQWIEQYWQREDRMATVSAA